MLLSGHHGETAFKTKRNGYRNAVSVFATSCGCVAWFLTGEAANYCFLLRQIRSYLVCWNSIVVGSHRMVCLPLPKEGTSPSNHWNKKKRRQEIYLIDECRQSPTQAHSERVLCMHVLADALFFQLKIDGVLNLASQVNTDTTEISFLPVFIRLCGRSSVLNQRRAEKEQVPSALPVDPNFHPTSRTRDGPHRPVVRQ